ncbi:MAG TPA: hypothetical protein VHC19_26650 [Pirellulales bacterium]|nr:hypothetical protein [Pirellulales bacterium]
MNRPSQRATDAQSEREAAPSLWPYLLLCAAAALWIDFGSLHRWHHSDSLLPALISLYRWTPFYWELDRIGMLAPLIARPVKHPLFNLLVQDGLYVFCALSALVLMARYLLRNGTFPVVGVLSVAAFLSLTPGYYRFEYMIDTQYGVWLFLGLASLILLERPAGVSLSWPRRISAVMLMVLAHWVYCTATMFLGPLIVFRAVFCANGGADIVWALRRGAAVPAGAAGADEGLGRRRGGDISLGGAWQSLRENAAAAELGHSLATLAIGFAAGLCLMQLAPIHDTDFASLPISDWPRTWRQLLATSWTSLAPQRWPWFLLAAAAFGLSAYCLPAVRKRAQANWRSAIAALTAATMIGLFIGTRHWVVANSYAFRFLLPSALMTQAALLGIAAAPLSVIVNQRASRFVCLAALPLMLGAAAIGYGRPSLDGVYKDLDPYYDATAMGVPPGIGTRDMLDCRCTHVAGDYWKVWHAVFRANLALYERGERKVIWGLSLRSQPTHRYWSKIPREQMRVAIAAGGDPEADAYLAHYQLGPLGVSEQRESLWLLQPQELLAAKASEKTPVRTAQRLQER